jgi:hypothetical protein
MAARGAATKLALVATDAWDPFAVAAWRLGCETASLGGLRGGGPAVVVFGDVVTKSGMWRRASELAALGIPLVAVTGSDARSLVLFPPSGKKTTLASVEPRTRAEELRACGELSVPCVGVPSASIPTPLQTAVIVGTAVVVDADGRVAFVHDLGGRDRLLDAAIARATAR